MKLSRSKEGRLKSAVLGLLPIKYKGEIPSCCFDFNEFGYLRSTGCYCGNSDDSQRASLDASRFNQRKQAEELLQHLDLEELLD